MPRRLALIIGVSQYEPKTDLRALSAPVNDAQAVYEVLKEHGGFDALYTLPLGNNQVGVSGKVSAQELTQALKDYLSQTDAELVVIYFSGHGVVEDGKGAFLSASDDRMALALSWLVHVAKTCQAAVCLWLDCCHSGAVLDFVEVEHKGLCVIAASSAQGEALALAGNSLLTQRLCEALTPTAQHPVVSMRDLIQRLQQSRQNLPQQVLLQHSGADLALTALEAKKDSFSEIPQWASATGVDEYGRYAEIKVKDQTQRLRWVNKSEAGFWLADTACTQAFWLAVMGKNPAEFQGDLQLPVERVSWYMAQNFLDALNVQVAGLKARLPSVAEWELACAATSAADYHANAKRTIVVQALAPNALGLYQMLGNVWEWCAGDADDEVKPLRGGSWASAETLDCSKRGQSAAGNRDYTIGFRLAI